MSQGDFSADRYWNGTYAEHGATGVAVGIPILGSRFNEWMHRARRDTFLRTCRSLSIEWPSARILDFGSGVGLIVHAWQELGVSQLVASDLTTASVRYLERSAPGVESVVYDLGSGDPLPVDGAFDAVSAIDVLFHIIDDNRYRAAVSTIAGALRPGGYAVLSEGLMPRERDASDPCVWRTRSDILSILASAGLHVQCIVPFVPLLSWPVTARRALQPWWYAMRGAAALGEVGLGAAYALDRVVARVARAGPATKLVVCTRNG